MTVAQDTTSVINSTLHAVSSVIPSKLTVGSPTLIKEPIFQQSVGVLIGMTGDIKGRLIIQGEETKFSAIGNIMFGMPLEGEMLQSFIGELGNMIAGNLSTSVATQKISMDITPPTILVGQTQLYGFKNAFHVPVDIEGIGSIHIILIIEM
ncbi:chemotaxis protein CheX [Bacillus timonensis]|nr:chemotaxis protein CheX [Bacillus timonensis]